LVSLFPKKSVLYSIFCNGEDQIAGPNNLKGMTRQNKNILIIVLTAFFLVLMLRFRFMLVILLILAAVAAGIVVIVNLLLKQSKAHQFQNSDEGKIAMKIEECNEQILKNNNQNKEISKEINDWKARLNGPHELSEKTKTESKRILHGFERELELRKTKVRFYETCLQKLETLLYNNQTVKALEQKQERLKQLREKHYEDLADMESIKSDIAFDLSYLESIETLSLQMLESDNLDVATGLQKEREAMPKEIRSIDR
jgi:hypothetical protein